MIKWVIIYLPKDLRFVKSHQKSYDGVLATLKIKKKKRLRDKGHHYAIQFFEKKL